MTILFDNEYCTIINNFGLWIRVDKATGHDMTVSSYFDCDGKLIRNE